MKNVQSNYIFQDMYVYNYTISNKKTQNNSGLIIPLDTTHIRKNNNMLSEKAPAEELDENNQKRLQKIVGKFLYYARKINPTMLMALKSLVAIQTKPKIETPKKITQFLNYSVTHTEKLTEYISS